MGDDRAVRHDARMNRTKILEAYRTLVVENGLDIEMEDIAATAGVTRPTVYRHYRDRDTLRREVQSLILEEVAAAVRRVVTEGDAQPIEATLTSVLRVIVRNLRQWGLVFVGTDNFDSGLLRKWSQVARPIDELIRAGQRNGEIRPDLSSGLLVNSMIWSAQATLHTGGSNSDLQAGDPADMIASLFLDGARVSQQRGRTPTGQPTNAVLKQ